MTLNHKSSLSRAVLLLLILLVGVLLRVWGMDYGLPHPMARPDEERIVGRALRILTTGDFHPGEFAYPGLLKYLNASVLWLFVWLGKLFGRYDELWDFLFEVAVTRRGLQFQICRSVSVVLGAGTALVAYFLAREAYRSRIIGLMASGALATCFLHVRDSRFATVDVAMTFFVTVSLLFAVRAGRDFRTRDFLWAGVFAGLATATKYTAGLAFLGVCASSFPLCIEGTLPNMPRGTALARRLGVAAAAMAVAFVVSSPYSVIRFPAVWDALRGQSRVLYGGDGTLGLWIHLGITFPEGLGWPLFLASMAGVLRAAWLRRSADWVLLAFLIPSFLAVAPARWVFPRYVMPLIPVLAVLAAELSFSVVCRSKKTLALIAGLILAVPGFWRSVEFDRVASKKDTRVLASEWVDNNLPPRTGILLCKGYGAPRINRDRRRPPAFDPKEIPCMLVAVSAENARYLVTHEHPVLTSYSAIADDLRAWLERHGRRLAVFDPFIQGTAQEPYFYPSDAFYLPVSHLEVMERGGPVLTVWELERQPSE